MDGAHLKERLVDRLWQVVDQYDHVLSATLTGSFVESSTLVGLSDIDLVLIVDHLNQSRFQQLISTFDAAIRPVLRRAGYDLLVNPTLGPLKFNATKLAVLHLMLYSHEAHVEHVIQSPFTCFDWQRSRKCRKRSLAQMYPIFGLQPRHFQDARRSVKDYLRDFHERVVSYRELDCDEHGYREITRAKPMTERDRHEFAYHVIRFLMRNLLKLVRRSEAVPTDNEQLGEAFFRVFPERIATTTDLFRRLSSKRKSLDFATSLPDLDGELAAFVEAFEAQFHQHFYEEATRHVVFRHAPTPAQLGARSFVGRTDHDIATKDCDPCLVIDSLRDLNPIACFSSPLARCRQTLATVRRRVSLPSEQVREALREIDYGQCEGLSVTEARGRFPGLFTAWDRGEDPCFPGGQENNSAVAARANQFVREAWKDAAGNTVTCTHNVVLRTLVGYSLGVPPSEWHRLNIPHVTPITFVSTREFGVFVELAPSVERQVFRDFSLLRN